MSKSPNLIEVELTGPHTHYGKPYDKGDRIQVPPHRADWLAEQGKIAPRGDHKPATPAPSSDVPADKAGN